MAKKAILGGMGLSLREALKHSMNIFLNELYALRIRRKVCARWWKSASPTGRIAEHPTVLFIRAFSVCSFSAVH